MDRLRKFKKSLRHAISGLKYVIAHEKNFQYDLIAAAIVVFGMFYFDLERWETIVLLLVIAGILAMELFNTVVERVVDILKPRIHPYAKLIKDLMAAGVLTASLFALVVGAVIFLPHIAEKFNR